MKKLIDITETEKVNIRWIITYNLQKKLPNIQISRITRVNMEDKIYEVYLSGPKPERVIAMVQAASSREALKKGKAFPGK